MNEEDRSLRKSSVLCVKQKDGAEGLEAEEFDISITTTLLSVVFSATSQVAVSSVIQ